MEVRLQPSLSAPDLTDLLEARRLASEDVLADSQTDNHRHQRKHVTPTTVQARDGGDDDDQDDICEHRSPEPTADIPWPAHRLPTPADSRSPSPSDDTDEPYHLRTRSESPEVFRRSPRSDRFHRTQSTRSRTDLQGSDVASEPAGMAGETSQMSSIERKQESLSVPPPLRPGPSRAPSSRPVVMPGSVPLPHEQANLSERILPASLWDYLQEELRASELDGSQELKAERVTNFFAVPMAVEKIIVFGYFVCLDSFLYNFTILPIRSVMAGRRLIGSYFKPGKRKTLPVSMKCDIAKFSIFLITSAVLYKITDASKMYHSVRGQEVIKLYVIFNVLEIADKLCCSFGQDLLDSLCSRATLGRREDGSQPRIRPAGLFGMCVIYTIVHTLVLFYSLVSLNVAINSYDNALLTLLLSNQFVEIKGAVLKKFEKENLFQMSCADIVERFQLSLMLFIIAVRNLIELSGSTFSLLPTSFVPVLPSMTVLQRIFSPALIVILSELTVDWLKHAFITKFNHIRPAVYGRFIDVLCRDLIAGGSSSNGTTFADQSPSLARRLGFASLPMACLVVRVIFQTFEMLVDTSQVDECAPPRKGLKVGRGNLGYLSIGPEGQRMIVSLLLWTLIACVLWACLLIMKLLIGINLRAFAVSRYAGMEERAREDQLNDRNRAAIGLNSLEKIREDETLRMLDKKEYDSPGKFTGRVGGSNQPSNMETLSRFSMIKSRIY